MTAEKKPDATETRPEDSLQEHSCESGACEIQCRFCADKFCIESDPCLKRAIEELDASKQRTTLLDQEVSRLRALLDTACDNAVTYSARVTDLESRSGLLAGEVERLQKLKDNAVAMMADAPELVSEHNHWQFRKDQGWTPATEQEEAHCREEVHKYNSKSDIIEMLIRGRYEARESVGAEAMRVLCNKDREIADLTAKIAAAEAEVTRLREHVALSDEMTERSGAGRCGCSHAPCRHDAARFLEEREGETAKLKAAEADISRLRELDSAAIWYRWDGPGRSWIASRGYSKLGTSDEWQWFVLELGKSGIADPPMKRHEAIAEARRLAVGE